MPQASGPLFLEQKTGHYIAGREAAEDILNLLHGEIKYRAMCLYYSEVTQIKFMTHIKNNEIIIIIIATIITIIIIYAATIQKDFMRIITK
jgi:hypothetical protein